jgi:large-conductance mechanosensitive channel
MVIVMLIAGCKAAGAVITYGNLVQAIINCSIAFFLFCGATSC